MSTPNKPELFDGAFTFTQDGDSCDANDTQALEVKVEDGGGGKYLVIKTDRWAIDSAEELAAILNQVIAMFGEEWNA